MSKVKPILYMLGKGGSSVLQTAIFWLLKSQSLQISILQHIAQDILRFTFTSTHLTNFFSGEEGDLSVGFPDRFNSSYYY